MLEATKVHQLKLIDHHVSNTQEPKPKVLSNEITHQDNQSRQKSQSYCAACNEEDPATPKAVVKQSCSTSKVTKDSLIGVSIMVAMLLIMSIWGRVCAILCMSAGLYCIPLIQRDRDATVSHTNTSLDTDLNTKLHKKKVMLHGLLQRDNKLAIGIS